MDAEKMTITLDTDDMRTVLVGESNQKRGDKRE